MDIIIRPETEADYEVINSINDKAFRTTEESELIRNLRESEHFVPKLSLVAEKEGHIIGHILFTKTKIEADNSKEIDVLILAPMSVLPEFQNKGYGSILVGEGLRHAEELKYKAVVVLGHPWFYPKFGFKKASEFGIKANFKYPDEALMALELKDGYLRKASGYLLFTDPFGVMG